MERFKQMIAAENMMQLSVMANNQHGFCTGMENYAQARWDKIISIPMYPQGMDWMQRFESDRDGVFAELYKFVWGE